MEPGELSGILLGDLKALGWSQRQEHEVFGPAVLTRRKQGLTSFQQSRQYRLGRCPVICLMSSLNCCTPKGEEVAVGLATKLDICKFFLMLGAMPLGTHNPDSTQPCTG